jgi:2',3'-cyclic-nucleotide 2'-phosphodiesterase/3'-nucleotidase
MRWLLFLVFAAAASGAERTTVIILATTDVHGYILPYDDFLQQPAARGLAKVATIVKQIRKENPHALLIDCGDTIEGSPLAALYAAQLRRGDPQAGPNPVILAMNEMEYDAMVVGNHEFNYGMPVLLRAKKESQFPWLSANIIPLANAVEALAVQKREFSKAQATIEERVFEPMIVEDVEGVTVAILGLTTPVIPNWERAEHIEGYRFESAVDSAKEWVRYARQNRKADVVVVAAHLGLERSLDTGEPSPSQLPGENAVEEIARTVPGIDAIIYGHTHQEMAGKAIHGVTLAQAKNWAQSLAEVTITLERANDEAPWKVVEKKSRVIAVTDAIEPDAAVLKAVEVYQLATQKYLDTPVAEARAPLDTRLGRVADTGALDAIHEVQLAAGEADVSLAAMFNTNVRIPAGPITVRQLAALYIYENTLLVIEATGKTLKDALEHSARFFNGNPPGINPQVLGFNYDTAAGVSYKIDLSRPVGDRIQELRFQDAPLAADQKLRLAINSYRHAGGGGYTMLRGAKVLWQSTESVRQLMIDYYTRKKVIEGRPDNNWEIVPEAAKKALLANP